MSSDFIKAMEASELGDFSVVGNFLCAAAKRGSTEAQFALGVMYLLGFGVKQDYKTAYAWFYIAEYNGYGLVAKLAKLGTATFLSSSEVDEAKDTAERCINSDYKDCPC